MELDHLTGNSGGESKVYAEFYKNPVDGKDHVRMGIPGDASYAPDFEATEEYQARFPKQWELYKQSLDQSKGQIRLEEVAWIDQATLLQLKSLNIFTVEALAGVTDGGLQNIGPGASAMRERAQKMIEEKVLAASSAEKDEVIANLTARIEELEKAAAGTGRGRKKAPAKDA